MTIHILISISTNIKFITKIFPFYNLSTEISIYLYLHNICFDWLSNTISYKIPKLHIFGFSKVKCHNHLRISLRINLSLHIFYFLNIFEAIYSYLRLILCSISAMGAQTWFPYSDIRKWCWSITCKTNSEHCLFIVLPLNLIPLSE